MRAMPKGLGVAVVVSIVIYISSSACADPTAYTNYMQGTRIGGTDASAIWDGTYLAGPNPFSWYTGPDDPPAPFWRPNTRAYAEYIFTGAPTFDAELVGTIPFIGTFTLEAFDAAHPETSLGTMVWSATGAAPIDFNAARAVVDEANGLVMLRWGQPYLPADQPAELHTFVEESGLFASDGIQPVAVSGTVDEQLFITGWVLQPLMPELSLQDNIFAAPFIGANAEGVLTGHYVPEPATAVVAAVIAAGLIVVMRVRRAVFVGSQSGDIKVLGGAS